jgi:hypothetical protein
MADPCVPPRRGEWWLVLLGTTAVAGEPTATPVPEVDANTAEVGILAASLVG